MLYVLRLHVELLVPLQLKEGNAALWRTIPLSPNPLSLLNVVSDHLQMSRCFWGVYVAPLMHGLHWTVLLSPEEEWEHDLELAAGWTADFWVSARSDRWLKLVGQGSQHLVKLGVSQGLALLRPSAPPQQPHLEVRQEELHDLGLLLEACHISKKRISDCCRSLLSWVSSRMLGRSLLRLWSSAPMLIR